MRQGTLLFCVVGVLAGSGVLGAAGAQRGFLTAPVADDPVEIVRSYLAGQRGEPRAPLDSVTAGREELSVGHRYRSTHTGSTHVRLRQRLDGIDVVNGDVVATVTEDGRLLHHRDDLVPDLIASTNTLVPGLSAAQAVAIAAVDRGLPDVGMLTSAEPPAGPALAQSFDDTRISLDSIPTQLMLLPLSETEVRLVWHLVLRVPDGLHWWSLYVDAVTGEVQKRSDWIDHDAYTVFAPNLESPSVGTRSVVTDPADPTASPFGWHDTDGTAGAEFTDTRGNNVSAQEDADFNNSGGTRPDGGAGLVFDEPLDLNEAPGTYVAAATVNLFFWNNHLHDVFHHYGFDEPSGNFQVNNYGNGGIGGDPVQADAQDGSSTNNATFGTPPDGFDPRMQMYIWNLSATSELVVASPPAIAGTYAAGQSLFGPQECAGLAGEVVAATDAADATGPSTTDGCTTITNPGEVAGKIALIDRGDCFFSDKVLNAEAAGAIGVVIANNAGDGLVNMSTSDPAAASIAIPAVFIGQSDGATVRAQLPGVSATLTNCTQSRDSDLDNGVIAHEYMHGVSNRLTNGAANVDCLDDAQSGGMGEGWSDFAALWFTAQAGDQGTDPRGMGSYLEGQPPTGSGIRIYPYSTNMTTNPLTFSNISSVSIPHGVGTVWNSMLWEVYWNLVDSQGWDPDLVNGTGGNNLMLQLVVDAMKLQPCNPTFIEARDAILDADTNANAGAHHCEIWTGFAKRGLGEGASTPGSTSTTTTQSFTVPAGACSDLCSGVTCTALDACHTVGTCNPATGLCSNPNAPAGTACGDASTTECTLADTCDGAGTCAPNHLANGESCGDAGTECTHQDSCDGSGACTDNGFVAADTNCGDAGTECTHQDSCDGSGACTDNGFVAADTNCGDAGTECSDQDTCDGGGNCLVNHSAPGSACGDTVDQCTLADACDGSGACTDNGVQPNGTACDDGDGNTENDQCTAGTCSGFLPTSFPATSAAARGGLVLFMILSGLALISYRRRS